MSLVIFEIGPETRQVKKSSNTDRRWKIKCISSTLDDETAIKPKAGVKFIDSLNADKNYKASASLIFISTYKCTTAPSVDPTFSTTDRLISFTIKQATLIALNILGNKINSTSDPIIWCSLFKRGYAQNCNNTE